MKFPGAVFWQNVTMASIVVSFWLAVIGKPGAVALWTDGAVGIGVFGGIGVGFKMVNQSWERTTRMKYGRDQADVADGEQP